MSNQHIKAATETNRAVDAVTRLIETVILPSTDDVWGEIDGWARAYRHFAGVLAADIPAYWAMVGLQAQVLRLEADGINPADVIVSGDGDVVTTVGDLETFQRYRAQIIALLRERAEAHEDPFGQF